LHPFLKRSTIRILRLKEMK
jgi:hypothetical protein